jgi:hypothetical protein
LKKPEPEEKTAEAEEYVDLQLQRAIDALKVLLIMEPKPAPAQPAREDAAA